MASRTNPTDPFDDVRQAFNDLGTSEKAAFVLEATFETLGQALSETGRRAAAFVDDLDIDAWFKPDHAWDMGAPPPPPPAPEPPIPPAAPPPKAKKTAGKPKPPPDVTGDA